VSAIESAHPDARVRRRRAAWGDAVFVRLTQGAAILVLLLVVVLFAAMVTGAWPSLARSGAHFLTRTTWDPVREEFSALAFIWGTAASSLLALLIAVPVGLGTAIFLAELAPPWLRAPVSFLVELLAAVPSVVYGLWGVLVMVPWLQQRIAVPLNSRFGSFPLFAGAPYGQSLLAGGLVLAIMVLPIITAVARDVLLAVPATQREGSLALGSTHWEAIWRAVLPYGRAGILGAIILGLGRALGETMAVTMVIGNRPDISVSLLNPAYTMAGVLANEFTEATLRLHVAALIEIALLLFLTALIVNAAARWLVWRAGGMRRV
jgi:phosphate transport system permease protein